MIIFGKNKDKDMGIKIPRGHKYNHGYQIQADSTEEKDIKKQKKIKKQLQESVAPETKQVSKPEAHEETIKDDLIKGKAVIGYLYNLTKFILQYENDGDCPMLPSTVVKKWNNSLDMGNYNVLLRGYILLKKELKEKYSIEDYTNERNCIIFLKSWIRFLEKEGIEIFKECDENGNIVVTTENRKYYDNGSEFRDGTVCKVIVAPLTYKGELYYGGSLEKIETEEAENNEQQND